MQIFGYMGLEKLVNYPGVASNGEKNSKLYHLHIRHKALSNRRLLRVFAHCIAHLKGTLFDQTKTKTSASGEFFLRFVIIQLYASFKPDTDLLGWIWLEDILAHSLRLEHNSLSQFYLESFTRTCGPWNQPQLA